MATTVVCRSFFCVLFYSVLLLEALGQDGYLNKYGGVSSSDFKFPVSLRDRREAQAEVTLPSMTTTDSTPSSVTATQNDVNNTEEGHNFPDVIGPTEKPVNSTNLNQLYKYTSKPTTPVKTTTTEPSSTTIVPVFTEPTPSVNTTATEPSSTTIIPVFTEPTTSVNTTATEPSSTNIVPAFTEPTPSVKTTATEPSSTTIVPVSTEPTPSVKTTATEPSSTSIVPVSTEPTPSVKTTATEPSSTTIVPVSTEPTPSVKTTATEPSSTTIVPVSTEPTPSVKTTATEPSSTTIVPVSTEPTPSVKNTATEPSSTTIVPVSTEPTPSVKTTATEPSSTTIVPVSTEPTPSVKTTATEPSSTTIVPVSTEPTPSVKTTATEPSSTTIVPVSTEPTPSVKTTATEPSSTTIVPVSTEPTINTTVTEPSSTTSIKPETTAVDEYVDDDIDDDIHSTNITGYDTNDTMHFSHHKYYKSASYSGEEAIDNFWVDLDSLPPNMTKYIDYLSNAYRKAMILKPSFLFPFYGHGVEIILIATGGFISIGGNSHKWLAATQYISPLMANFDNRDSPDSRIRYADNGTALTVEWENMRLQKAENLSSSITDSPFTFQVTIHASGDIVFAYKDVPLQVDRIDDTEHPVRVGLSDAYMINKTIFNIQKQTLYEYHKIDMKEQGKISNTTAIVFKALPTCLSYSDCESCLQHNTSFQCRWCGEVGRCSDGMNRMRQDWLQSRCDYFHIGELSQCDYVPTTDGVEDAATTNTTRGNGVEDAPTTDTTRGNGVDDAPTTDTTRGNGVEDTPTTNTTRGNGVEDGDVVSDGGAEP